MVAFTPPNQNPPETKGMTVKATIKAEVDHALDLIVHNHNIPWPRVTAALKRVVNIIDASGRESYGHTADSAREAAVAREREKAEAAIARAEKAEADFEQMRKALSDEVSKTGRLMRELDSAPLKVDDHKRALEKSKAIVDAMLEHFHPAKNGKELAEDGVDATDADGVAYGEKIGIGELRYGDLEVARGAMFNAGVA